MRENHNEFREFIVGWCPVCDQGWIEIVLHVNEDRLKCECQECMWEWQHPLDIKEGSKKAALSDYWETNDEVSDPTYEDIVRHQWEKFLVNDKFARVDKYDD